MFPVRLAVVGCGAVTELNYLPAAALAEEVDIVALVDKNVGRARQLGERFGIDHSTEDYRELPNNVDGAIVALPHHLHAPVSIDLLNQGMHVLVEKPMALMVEQCQAMRLAARSANAILAVGHYRRFAANILRLKEVIDAGLLGTPLRYVCEEGAPYEWPSESGFVFDRAQAGGGVLIDAGVHNLDWVLWLFGEPDELEYVDDNFGGMEANCICRFSHANQVQGVLELSRTRTLDNRLTVHGPRASVAMSVWDPGDWHVLEGELPAEYATPPPAPEGMIGMFKAQLLNFVGAIRGNERIAVDGTIGERAVKWVERCYGEAQRLDLPWLKAAGT